MGNLLEMETRGGRSKWSPGWDGIWREKGVKNNKKLVQYWMSVGRQPAWWCPVVGVCVVSVLA